MSPSSVDLTIGGTSMSIVGAPQVLLKQQSGGPPICIVRFGKISVASGTTFKIVNSSSPGHVLSLQAVGDIDINGLITFTNAAPGPSPGTTALSQGVNANNKTRTPGGGGAGGAREGGTGGTCVSCGGANVDGGTGGAIVTTSATILNGGSVGGGVSNTPNIGGVGGGGIQIVSLTHVVFGTTGKIAVNGLGGGGPLLAYAAGGGGSGGTVVVEAPVVSLSTGALIAANGGGGAGGCYAGGLMAGHYFGQSGQLSSTRAAGGNCPGYGDGGYEANGATSPSANGSPSDADCATAGGGGGGGANGFIYLRARTANAVMFANASVVSPSPTTGAVSAN
jgi:hypothetical protein